MVLMFSLDKLTLEVPVRAPPQRHVGGVVDVRVLLCQGLSRQQQVGCWIVRPMSCMCM